jgi:hypothetical protein
MNNRKKLVLICVAVVVFAALIALMVGLWLNSRPEATEGSKTFTLTVVHSDGTSKDFTISTDREFLAEALLDENLIVESDSPGMYITVDGETADYSVNQSYWGFFIGDDYATEGMNTTAITDGAVYKLVYTIG